jgi:Ca-activated chloride channel family protein
VLALIIVSCIRFPESGFATSAFSAEDISVYAAPLSKLVEQLSEQPGLSATDCTSLAQETITWGKRLRDAGQPVTPGPVNDALAGVDLGEKSFSHAADWAKYRGQLQEFLKKPPEPPPQQQQQPPPPQQQKKEDQQKSDSQPKSQPPPEPTQANTDNTQKIGGQPRPQQGPKADPSLALPIQKLDQLRNQDSPAELFQMLDSRDNKPSPKKGRDW